MDEDNELNGSEMSHDDEMESDDDWIDQTETEDQQENVSPVNPLSDCHSQSRGLFQLEKSLRPIKRKWLYVINLKFFVWRHECHHGPACIAFHCSHLYITEPGSVSHFARTWVSLQTTTYHSKNTKYFGTNLLLT